MLYEDLNTVAMISCCVARHNVCSTCHGSPSLSHDYHDNIFGGRKVFAVCIFTWVVSVITMLPDFMGVSCHFFLKLCLKWCKKYVLRSLPPSNKLWKRQIWPKFCLKMKFISNGLLIGVNIIRTRIKLVIDSIDACNQYGLRLPFNSGHIDFSCKFWSYF